MSPSDSAIDLDDDGDVSPHPHPIKQTRSGSIVSPPPPPTFFNPPPDTNHPVVTSIEPPSPSLDDATSSQTSSQDGGLKLSEALLGSNTDPSRRPEVLQRKSADSGSFQSQRSVSSASASSDAGEHLAEAREKLLDEAVTIGEEELVAEAGQTDEVERAWDSVWPAPGTASRSGQIIAEHLPSFPIAPVSPFITPTFSPASVERRNRRGSPDRASPSSASPTGPERTTSHGHGPSSPKPILRSSSRHVRSQSTGWTPPGSPLGMQRSSSFTSLEQHAVGSTSGSGSSISRPESPFITHVPTPGQTKRRTSNSSTSSNHSASSSPKLRSRGFSLDRPDRLGPPRPHLSRRGSSTGSISDPLPPTSGSANSIRPISLPPPLTSPPGPSATSPQPSQTVEISRPKVMRRALSDYEKNHLKSLPRSLSDFDKPSTLVVTEPPKTPPLPEPLGILSEPLKPFEPEDAGPPSIVDEGDVLPAAEALEEVQFDVSFDDEGLTTLERIFLLSRSNFPFHRAYIVRVLGDLLYEVDPCESVDFVLPLLNQYTTDDEESVKESFVSQLHRILWYFYTSCEITEPEAAETPGLQDQRPSTPTPKLMTRTQSSDSNNNCASLPPLPANFFTPLLGALLLNSNPVIAESTRTVVVNLISRLKDRPPDPEIWGVRAESPDEVSVKTYESEHGLHSHRSGTISQKSRNMIESALISDIVVGMGCLSTEMPEMLTDDTEETAFFQEQLIAEAITGRATSLNLIGILCEFYTGPEAVEKGLAEEIINCTDGDDTIRIEGANAIKSFALIAPDDQIMRLVNVFEQLIIDTVYHVRQAVTSALPVLCRRIDPFNRSDFAVKAMQTLVDSGDGVRDAALETLGEVIYVFADIPVGPPAELLDIFTKERAGVSEYLAAFNFPGVCLTLGSSRWSELRPLYGRLHARNNPKVMTTLAASLHVLAEMLSPRDVLQDLIPVYKSCIQSTDEVREKVFEHIDMFLHVLDTKTRRETFNALVESWKDGTIGGWRAREQLGLHIPEFFQLFPEKSGMSGMVLELTKMALGDTYAAVRDAASSSIPRSYEILGYTSKTAEEFREIIIGLANGESFKSRIAFLRCIQQFIKPPPNQKAFEDFFVPRLSALSNDILDVRMALAHVVADLFAQEIESGSRGGYYGTYQRVLKQVVTLTKELANDPSPDVRDIIRHILLDKLQSSSDDQDDDQTPIPTSKSPADTKVSGSGTVPISPPHLL